MARPNRNNQDVLPEEKKISSNIEEKLYCTAIYARLSIEDNGIESDSIETQVYYLQKYVNEHKEMELIFTYCDNGMTGTNFQRPAFHGMLEAVKSGKINCIVVKDLSRFGRNYMETGNYLENIFPYLGVRFISINDNYDSINATANEKLALSLKNVYHHLYAKDISRKICTLFDVKKKNGLYLGRFAPYGYRKSEQNRYQLEIEEETAAVVSEIFALRMKGMGVIKIAKSLNDRGIPSQSRRLYKIGLLKGTNGEANALWSGSSVLGILENPVYYGCIVERKSEQAYYKGGRKRAVPKEEWNYIENTHEAIIDKDAFMKVQSMIEESKKSVKEKRKLNRERTENILKGLVVCGCCQGKMVRDGGYYTKDGKLIRHRFICRRKYLKNTGCSASSITEADLISAVYESIKKQIQLLENLRETQAEYRNRAKYLNAKDSLANKLKQNRAEIMELESKKLELYQDYKRGLLSENGYVYAQKRVEEQKQSRETMVERLKEQQRQEKQIVKPDTQWIEDILQFQSESCLTGELCLRLINKIVVYQGHIEIHYTFCSEYEQAPAFLQKPEVGEVI